MGGADAGTRKTHILHRPLPFALVTITLIECSQIWGSTMLAWTFGAVGVTGIILACVFYFRGKKEKKPRARKKSFNLISQSVLLVNPEKIKVTYADEPIGNLTVTNVAFWNAGREPIRSQDIPSNAPLYIQATDGVRILEAYVVQRNNPSNDLKCTLLDSNHLLLSFEYLDKDDGGVLQVFHTGMTSSDLQIKGKVIGASGELEAAPLTFPSLRVRVILTSLLVAIMSMVLVIFLDGNRQAQSLPYVVFSVAAVVTAFIAFLTASSLRSRKTRGVPPSLSSFDQLWV